MKRRFLAMLLSLAMVLTMLPVSAFAAVSLEGQSLTVAATSESDGKTVKVTTLETTANPSVTVSGNVYYSFLSSIPNEVPTSITVGDNGYKQITVDNIKAGTDVTRTDEHYIAVATLQTDATTGDQTPTAWGIALIDEPAALENVSVDNDRKITNITVGNDTYKYKVFAADADIDVITTKTTITSLTDGWADLTDTDTFTLPKTAEGTLVIVKALQDAETVSAIATAEVSAAAYTELTVTVSNDGKVEVKEGAQGEALATSDFSFYKVATDKQNWSTTQNWNAATKASTVTAYFDAKNELTLSSVTATKDVLTTALAGEMVVAIRTTGSGDTATLDAIGMSAAVTYTPPAAPTELTVTVDTKTNAVTVTKPGASQGADPETVNHTNLLFFTAATPNSWKTNNWKTDTTIADVQKALTNSLALVDGKLPDTQTDEVYLIAVEKVTVGEAVNLAGIGETTDKVKYNEPALEIGEVTVNATTNVITTQLNAGNDEEIKYALADKAFTGPVTAKTVWGSEVLSSTEGNKVVTYSPTNSQIDSTATGKYLIAAVVKSTENTVVSIACTKNTVTFYDSTKPHVTVSKQDPSDNNITIDTEVVEVAGTEADKGTATIKVTATEGYQPVVVSVGGTAVSAEDYQFTKGENNEYTLNLTGLSISGNTAVVIKSEATTPTGDTLTVLTVTVDTATNTVTVTKPGANAGDNPVTVDSTNLLFFTADATNSWSSKNWNTATDISAVETAWTSNALAVTNGKLPESMTTEAYVIAVEKASDKLAGIGETAAKVKYNEPALTIGEVTVNATTNVITPGLTAGTGESIKYALAEAKYTGPVTAKTVWATGVVSTENKITAYTPAADNKIDSTATGNYLIAAVVKDEGGTVVSIACTSAPVSYYDASKAHVTVTKQDPNDDKITIETTSVEVAGETADQGTATIKVTATEGYQPVVVSIGGTAVSAADYQFTKGLNNEYTLELTGLSISADTAVVIKSEATTPTVETVNVTVTTADDNVTIIAPAANNGAYVVAVEKGKTTTITVDVTEGYTPAITGLQFAKADNQTEATDGTVRWTATTPEITAATTYTVTATKDEPGNTTVEGNPNVSDDGTATGEVDTSDIDEVLNNATGTTDQIELDFSTPAGTTTPDKVEKAEIAIPTEAVESINDYNEAAKQPNSNKKEVSLSVKTPIGTVTVGSDVVEEMTKESTFTDDKGQTVTPDATTMEAKVVLNVEKVAVPVAPGEDTPTADEKQAFEIHFEKKLVRKGSDTVLATAPVEVKNTTVTITVATTVKPKTGTTTLIAAFVDGVKKTVVDWAARYESGNATFTTPHLSTFVLMAERDSDTPSGILIYDKDGNAVDLDDYSASGNALTAAGGKLVLPSGIATSNTTNVKYENGAWVLVDTSKDGTLEFTFEGKTYTATLKAATTTTPTTLTLTREGTIGYGIIKVKISGMTDGKVYLVESAATANNVTVNSYNVITGDSTGEAVIAISRGNVVTVTEHGSELDIANSVPPTATSNAFPAQ